MENYAQEWKKYVNFTAVSYNDFVSEKGEKILPAYLIEKIDGMLGALVWEKEKDSFFLTSHSGIVKDLTVHSEYNAVLEKTGLKQAVLIGEIVVQKGGKILPFNVITSVVKTAYKKPENDPLIHHYLFDVFYLNNNRVTGYRQALSFLSRYFTKYGGVKIRIPRTIYGGMSDFRKLFDKVIKEPGKEGVVVRTDSKAFKIKISDTLDLAVIGGGKVGLPAWEKDQVSYLKLAFIDKDGNFRYSGKVGTGFTHSTRSSFFKYLHKKKLYEEGGEIFVEPELIVEIKYFRYNITTTGFYRFTGKKYEKIGEKKSVTLIQPSFVRIRDDKKPNSFDVRMEQIPEFKD